MSLLLILLLHPSSSINKLDKRFDTTGYDIHPERVREQQQGRDRTLEVTAEELRAATKLRYSSCHNMTLERVECTQC